MAAPTFFFCWGGGGVAIVKEYEIIKLRYIGKTCRLCLIYIGAAEDIIL